MLTPAPLLTCVCPCLSPSFCFCRSASAILPLPFCLCLCAPVNLTRYNRNWVVAPGLLSTILGPRLNVRTLRYINTLAPRGYAVVAVDVRGTGASEGSRPTDLSPAEVADFPEVVEWVLRQPWCDKRLCAGGISYDALTGLKAASMCPGKIQAVFALFTPIDVLEDLVAPGGLPCSGL